MSNLTELEKLELEVNIMKAEAAKKELDLKILKLKDEIARVEKHKALQDQNIEKYNKKLAEG